MTRSLENTIRMGIISACRPDSISRFYRAPVETEFGYAYVSVTGTDDPKGWTELLITGTDGITSEQLTELVRCCVAGTKGIKTLIMIDGNNDMLDQFANVIMPSGQNMFFSHLWKNPQDTGKGCRSFLSNDYRFDSHPTYKSYSENDVPDPAPKMFSEKQIEIIKHFMYLYPDKENFLKELSELEEKE